MTPDARRRLREEALDCEHRGEPFSTHADYVVQLLDQLDAAHRALSAGLDCIRGRKAQRHLDAGYKGMGHNILQESACYDRPGWWEKFEALALAAFGEPQKYDDALAAATARSFKAEALLESATADRDIAIEQARAATARAEAAERDATEMRKLLQEIRDQREHDGGCSSHCILSASERPGRIIALAKEPK